jgi:hypothetical protein
VNKLREVILDAVRRATTGLNESADESAFQAALATELSPSERELRAVFAPALLPPRRPPERAISVLAARTPPRLLRAEGRDPCAAQAKLDLLWHSADGAVRQGLQIVGIVIAIFLAQRVEAQKAIPDSVIDAAIRQGLQFKSRASYLEDGTRDVTCTLANIWSRDGITKEVRFFSDFDVIAAAAADAQRQMRPFGVEDAKKLPLTGLLHVNVQMTAHGLFPVKTLQQQYASKGVHTVLSIRDSVVQPLDATTVKSDVDGETIGVLFNWYRIGNTSLITGTPLGFQNSHFEQEFAYAVAVATLPGKVKVFVIDSDGGKSEKECDVSGVTHR